MSSFILGHVFLQSSSENHAALITSDQQCGEQPLSPLYDNDSGDPMGFFLGLA